MQLNQEISSFSIPHRRAKCACIKFNDHAEKKVSQFSSLSWIVIERDVMVSEAASNTLFGLFNAQTFSWPTR